MLERLADELLDWNQMEGKYDAEKGRIYLNNKSFTQYIELKDGVASISVWLPWGTVAKGEKYTPEQTKKCIDRKNELIDELNEKSLSVKFAKWSKS